MTNQQQRVHDLLKAACNNLRDAMQVANTAFMTPPGTITVGEYQEIQDIEFKISKIVARLKKG